MEKEPRFKASVMMSTLAFIGKDLGEPALQSILASYDSKEIAGRQFLPSDWLPERTHRDLLVATGKYLESTARHKNPKEFFFQMGRYLAQDGINKYYKSLISAFDTKFMLTKSPLLWGVIHSHGSFKVEPTGKNGAIVYITDYPTPSKEWCLMMGGYMYAVAEMTKARDMKIQEVECVNNGAKRCKFVGEWK